MTENPVRISRRNSMIGSAKVLGAGAGLALVGYHSCQAACQHVRFESDNSGLAMATPQKLRSIETRSTMKLSESLSPMRSFVILP